MNNRRQLRRNSLQILGLCSFAFAQPIFAVLSRNVDLFVARSSDRIDILLLVVILCVVPPLIILLLEILAGAIRPQFLPAIHSAATAILMAAILSPLVKSIGWAPATLWLALAVVLGTAFSLACLRLERLQSFLVFLSPASLLFPLLFLFSPPIRRLMLAGEGPAVSYSAIRSPAPIVMVVFDEFPVTSLMDETQQIDPKVYPNFAALSKSATWYRNASTVSEATLGAVPTILDGRYPRPELALLPNAEDHPRSLFTLLGRAYKFNVVENNTRLCPEALCGGGDKPAVLKRIKSLVSDISVVYLYVLLPAELSTGLPDITHSWKDFTARQPKPRRALAPWLDYEDLTDFKNRMDRFREFVKSIQLSSEPTLHFLHILLPHGPWEFLPSGKRYTLDNMSIRGVLGINDRGEDPNVWVDSGAVIEGYQRHLLQVGLVDRLLGELVQHLKGIGLYDPALVVVTADHGSSFRLHQSRRRVSPTNHPDIMAIPLFIKSPYQTGGGIDDCNVETIDILPTIADILNADLPWNIDGRSALLSLAPAKANKIVVNTRGERLAFSPTMDTKYETVLQKLRLFGAGNKPDGLFKIGRYSELIGRPSAEIGATKKEGTKCEINGTTYYNDVDPDGPILLSHVTGRIDRFRQGTFKPIHLAVGVNGVVGGVATTYLQSKKERFSVVVPDRLFRKGRNEISVFEVAMLDGWPKLAEIRSADTPRYQWGTPLHFSADGNAKVYQAEGWAAPEEYFTWILGKHARIVLPTSVPRTPMTLKLRLGAFLVPGKVDQQHLRILVNHRLSSEWSITRPGFYENSLVIPKDILDGSEQTIITFETPDAVSPVSVGSGSDVRELSVALSWLSMTPQTE